MIVFTRMTRRDTDGCPQADGDDGLHSPDTAKLMSTDEIGNERTIGQQLAGH